MKTYGAITIGPIINALDRAASPGTLWCASGMFSGLSGDLCERILTTINDAEIIAPAYKKGVRCTDGIGRWHDRIFFCCPLDEQNLGRKLTEVCAQARMALAENIRKAITTPLSSPAPNTVEKYIQDYIQISWLTASEELAHADGKNCILNLSTYLDSLELTASFAPEESTSPVTRLLTGTDESTNAYIRSCWLMEGIKQSQLLRGGKIRDIENVANPENSKSPLKKYKYFAAVQADGDNIGTALKQCPDDKDLHQFSQKCMDYTGKAAGLIGEYGGLTIYAGGDDLLFLAPLEGKIGDKTVSLLTLLGKITQVFDGCFKDYQARAQEDPPSLSFGVSVNFYKAPLYEALEDARTLLFGIGKTDGKRHIALAMHKHSGQSVELLIPNCWNPGTPAKELENLICKDVSGEDELLHSILYHIQAFRESFSLCRKLKMDMQQLYLNLFDSSAHDDACRYINDVRILGESMSGAKCQKCSDERMTDNGQEEKLTDDYPELLCSMLRFAKLYVEEGEE